MSFGDWLEKKGYNLIIITIIVQVCIYVLFTILFIVSDNELTVEFIVYLSSVLALFLVYMIHFAVHSIKNAYVVELAAFLIMSSVSSCFNEYCFYKYIINKFENAKVLFNVIAIFCMVILVIGNIVYFLASYYTYNLFEVKAIEKLGSKPVMHKMFSYVQFHHSMLKLDLGLAVFLYTTLGFFNYEDIPNLVASCVAVSVMIVIVIFCKKFIRSEDKGKVYLLIILRNLLEGYRLFRTISIFVINTDDNIKFRERFNFGPIVIYIASALNLVIFIIVDVLTVICVKNFGMGMKEMLISQRDHRKGEVSDSNGQTDPEQSLMRYN